MEQPLEADRIVFSNSIRLSGRQWLGVTLFAILFIFFAPVLWKMVEPFPFESDYRMPYDLRDDYWLYERYADLAAGHCDSVVIGDSVVWGVYGTKDETLSHYLNEIEGGQRYANLGLVGAHPLALGGLVEHYAGSISGKNVVLQLNPLWLTTPWEDLQDDKRNEFYHPRLVPQFWPRIPAYKEDYNTRLGVVVEQHTIFGSWTSHLQEAYYDHKNIPSWTLEHPYDNPVKPLTLKLPTPNEARRFDPRLSWKDNKIPLQDYPWVDLSTSLQWPAFQRVVQILQRRGNRVFVLVGPFNGHLLNPESKERYQKVKETIADWLAAQQIPHAVPEPLPSDLYGDASHPLAAGYEMLARQLLADPSFRSAQGLPKK